MNKTLGENKIPCNDKEINFLKGFFALKMYAGLMGIKHMQEAWSRKDPLKAYPELQKVITFKLYNRRGSILELPMQITYDEKWP